MKEIEDLIDISRYYGANKDYTLGGGGNTSFKNKDHLFVKASGYSLADITEKGFAVLDREKLSGIMDKKYSEDKHVREAEVKDDLIASNVNETRKLRPSVEASLHDIINYPFVVHMHPYLVNALMCGNNAEQITRELFGEEVLFVPYIDPGYTLCKVLNEYLIDYTNKYNKDPQIIFLQNHGVFVGAGDIRKIKDHYAHIHNKIQSKIAEIIKIQTLNYKGPLENIQSALQNIFGKEKVIKYRYNTLIEHFTRGENSISRIDKPFTPDGIVYCRAHPLVIPLQEQDKVSIGIIEKLLGTYREQFNYDPKIILVENGPVISIENQESAAELVLDVYEDAMKISFYSNYFGGPHFMTEEQIEFIESWEVESFRRKLSVGNE